VGTRPNGRSVFTNHITVGGEGVPYKFPIVKEAHPNPEFRVGMSFRSSHSWFSSETSVRRYRNVPFVTSSGKFSAHKLCVWRCYSEQMIMSLISTVNSRLLRILEKRFHHNLSKRWLNVAFKTSIVYVITRDNWVIDRFLGMSRPSGRRATIKSAENHITFCVYALDENKRFVYSQAYFQANWLKYQVFRPRDKSSNKVNVGSHIRALTGFCSAVQLDDDFRIASLFQIPYGLCDREAILPRGVGVRYASSLGSTSSVSELCEVYEEPKGFWSSDEE